MNMTLTSFVSEENRPLQTYPRRFWILGVFSVLAWFQCVQWNLWGPLSESVEAAFAGWGSGTVAMMANWGTITFVFLTIPMVWFLIKKGLRWGVLTITSITLVSTIMRTLPFFTSSDTFFTVMCHLAAIINGLVGPLIMTSPPLIASVWFPPRERTTATAFGQLFNQLGNAGSYLQPLIVRSPEDADREEIRSDIARLMYIWQVYVSVIAGFSLNFSTVPLFTELAVECVYPCSEQVVAGFLSFGMCAVGIIFLSVFLIPNIGYGWVTYLLLGTSCLSLIPLSFVRENYNRTNVDKGRFYHQI